MYFNDNEVAGFDNAPGSDFACTIRVVHILCTFFVHSVVRTPTGPPQDHHRAGSMRVVDHSQHCSDTDVVVVVLVCVVLVWTVRDDSPSSVDTGCCPLQDTAPVELQSDPIWHDPLISWAEREILSWSLYCFESCLPYHLLFQILYLYRRPEVQTPTSSFPSTLHHTLFKEAWLGSVELAVKPRRHMCRIGMSVRTMEWTDYKNVQ
ncbi:hypothetical protein NFI96_001864 [Prochilodus magdalenae]|nr:hypothetical protein NFI96_001864 [Prochilodus magdalenae]